MYIVEEASESNKKKCLLGEAHTLIKLNHMKILSSRSSGIILY